MTATEQQDGIIKLAALAVGGQGGGVLTNWIVALAENNGYVVQSTSVAGVAQRTGATIYYLEMAPKTDRQPVFSLSPSKGDVDILIACELMEAGRAVLRGFVTPDRTTLIASTHRILAATEKITPGDGRADSPTVIDSLDKAAHKLVCFDLETVAIQNGSVISASTFGALAGSGALPFARESFEDCIRQSGKGVEASLRAFDAAYDLAGQGIPDEQTEEPTAPAPVIKAKGPAKQLAAWQALENRIGELPAPVQDMATSGLQKVVDYQDAAYGHDYLDSLSQAVNKDDGDYAFAIDAAKYLANAMCYDDVIRVADLKIRASRFTRVEQEVAPGNTALMDMTEYFHPRMEEICGTLPGGLGRFIENHPRLLQWMDKRVNKGRRIQTNSLRGFFSLWLVGALRPWRRKLLRHQFEMQHLQSWYALALETLSGDKALAIEVLRCRRLIKGYSDTHKRGHSKFDRVLAVLPLLHGRKDASEWLARLRDGALKDEKGEALDGMIRTVESFAAKVDTAQSA